MNNTIQFIFSLLFSSFFALPLYAQSNKIDSIKTLLSTAKVDTIENKLYLDIGLEFEKFNVDSSLVYYEMALNKAKRSNFLFGEANAKAKT
jgi:hypothetical protein